jgi:hypothetical protein
MNQIAYRHIFSPDFEGCRTLLQDVLKPAREKNLLPVWSWESYATDILANRRVRARNLRKVFGKAKIAMALRNPIDLLESAYFLWLKRENIGAKGKRGRPPVYFTISEWLEKDPHGEVMHHLEYAQTIQAYVDQFDRENVHVFLFEDLREDPEGFFRRICRTMGIDEDEGVRLTEGQQDNLRWTVRQIDTLEELKRSFRKSLRFRLATKKARKETLGLDRRGVPLPGEKASAPIPPHWKERVFKITSEGNRWLEKIYNLPLARYGYFG